MDMDELSEEVRDIKVKGIRSWMGDRDSLLFFHGGSGTLIEVASTPTRAGRCLDGNFGGSHAVAKGYVECGLALVGGIRLNSTFHCLRYYGHQASDKTCPSHSLLWVKLFALRRKYTPLHLHSVEF